ncbi:MAG: universal stress protein [Desulfobacterales bacterium]|jgi:nucleotide-binding universal stress UspA family protein
MMPEIKKILYATDLSPNSAYAFRYAINSAKKHDAGVIILHVVQERAPFFEEERLKTISDEKVAEAMDQIKDRLRILSEKERKEDPQSADRVLSIEVCKGYPPEEILRKADELSCDVIVMGTHGKGIIRHSFLGSTAQKVLRRVRKPVFIIPLPEGEIDVTFHDE